MTPTDMADLAKIIRTTVDALDELEDRFHVVDLAPDEDDVLDLAIERGRRLLPYARKLEES